MEREIDMEQFKHYLLKFKWLIIAIANYCGNYYYISR